MKDASRYTKAVDGGLIDVNSVDLSNRYARGPYRCLSCNHLMVPALGRTRKHHFKHKAGRPQNCADETYLHQLGKLTLFNAISDAIKNKKPFPLNRRQSIVCDHHEAKFGAICRNRTKCFSDDLASRFDIVEIEKGVAGFIADLLLTSSEISDYLLIEITVTHQSTPEKISSGLSVVEIKINCENDIEALKEGIETSAANVIFHHLPDIEPVQQRCSDPCEVPCTLFLFYNSGKAWYSHTNSSEAASLISDPSLVTWEVAPAQVFNGGRGQRSFLDLFKQFILKQKFQHRHDVRACMLCRHNGGQKNAHDIYCNYRDRNVWMSSSACHCLSYDPATDAEEAKVLLDYNLNTLS
jgi:(2Fe-2S) ferredoxin